MKIKELRIKNNLTQTQLAKLVNTSQRSISNYENGNTAQVTDTLIRIADYFKTTTDNLLNHNVPYLLDKSTLSDSQKQIVEYATKMTDEECRLTLAYIEGTKAGLKERNDLIKLLKG